ncbi:alpha/beta hydrolase [Kitasatospora sp. NPDC050543]|uniref:alpha/beta hydrolase n=1 Tax=Kitasatospora sp. NPDC050543 TaxID=3364054 RepID=UPI00378A651C
MTTIVLVHGLWADGSAWSETITELRALGHEPIAAQLPLDSMEDDITAVRRVLSTVDGPVLLVGWSYGGAVITNAAVGQDHVKALSYIAAFAPDQGESVSDIAHRNPGSVIREHIRVTDDGHSYIDRPAYGEVIAADAPAARTALAAAVQKLPRLGIDSAPSGPPAWRQVPSHYLVATQDRALPAATQHELAARIGAQTTEWDTGHGPMYALPKELAAYLHSLTQNL